VRPQQLDDLQVVVVVVLVAHLVDELDDPDDLGPALEGHAQDAPCGERCLVGELPLPLGLGLDVVDYQRDAGLGHPAGDALAHRDLLPQQGPGGDALGHAEAQRLLVGREQHQGAGFRGRDLGHQVHGGGLVDPLQHLELHLEAGQLVAGRGQEQLGFLAGGLFRGGRFLGGRHGGSPRIGYYAF